MPDFAGALGASRAAASLLVLFVPSKDRGDSPIDQLFWVETGFPLETAPPPKGKKPR
jgi:hypothetical protein